MNVWLSSETLLAGTETDLEIQKAVRASDAVVICLSEEFNRAGDHLRIMRLALDTALEQPEGEIYIIPARLEECEMPHRLEKYHAVDLFVEGGYEKLCRSLNADAEKKAARQPQATQRPARTQEGRSPRSAEVEDRTDTPLTLPAIITNLHALSKGKTLAALSFVVALIVLLFGDNIYSQMTGRSVFADPTPFPTATIALMSTPTDTARPSPTVTITEPPSSSTASPVTSTATQTLTPTRTVVPPVSLGKDWLAGCISLLWQPLPTEVTAVDRGDGCWTEPLHYFVAENGDLDFLAHRRGVPVEISGLFAPLPEQGRVTISIRLRELTNVDLWMGVFAQPDINSEGLLMIIPAGHVEQRPFVQKEIRTYETLASTAVLEQANGFSIAFTFTPNSARGTVNPSVFNTASSSIPSSQKWLFLGYRGLGGNYRIDGTFLNFQLD
jgi:hypothetical protein